MNTSSLIPSTPLFRAIPRDKVRPGQWLGREEGRRLPSNVPYVVDNVWEFTRPSDLPSRRHSVYASPTPALALENATAGYLERSEYAVCRLEFKDPPLVLQLDVTDARHHRDVRAIQRAVMDALGRNWAALPLATKRDMTPLFVPGVTKEELHEAMEAHGQLKDVLQKCAEIVTLWDRSGCYAPVANGELFFELQAGNAYTMMVVDEALQA